MLVGIGVLLGSSGCASAPGLEAAQSGDWAKLASSLQQVRAEGRPTEHEAAELAEAILSVVVRDAKGVDGERTVRSLAPCAHSLEAELLARSETNDEVAAAVLAVLLSRELIDADDVVDFALDRDPRASFRALGARALVEDEDFALRRELFLDLDEDVRLAALRAAVDAPSRDDLDALVDAIRREPSAAGRVSAARALGRVGGARAVSALVDRAAGADPSLREAIVEAFLQPESFASGGNEALTRLLESGASGAVAVAALLAAPPGEGASAEGPDQARAALRERAMATLVTAMARGTREDRFRAILTAPASPATLEALRSTRSDQDSSVAALAHARLARIGTTDDRAEAVRALHTLAQSKKPGYLRALAALAALGEARVQPLLDELRTSAEPSLRAQAGVMAVHTGAFASASLALADRDPQVRIAVACSILSARSGK
jgi:hypothetical protein